MMKKVTAIVLCMVVLISTSGCAQKQDEVVKVGWIGALTGDMAVWGQSESNATQMFFEEINANGGLLGKQIEVVSYDTRGDSAEAVNAVKRLTGQDKVVSIIGPNTSGQAIPISSALEETQVTNIATVATNPKVTVVDGKVKPFNFRVCFIDTYTGKVAASYVLSELKFTKGAILYDVGDDYSQGVTEFFEEHFIANGGELVAKEAFKTGDVDFRPQMTKIKDSGAEVIFMPYSFKEVALSAKQARELGITATLIGTDTWPSDQLITMGGDALEGSILFVNDVNLEDPLTVAVKERYIEKYGKAPEINCFLAWDACTLLLESIKKANSFDTVAIRDAMETVEFEGLTGVIKIGKDTHNPDTKAAVVNIIENGEFKYLTSYAPEE